MKTCSVLIISLLIYIPCLSQSIGVGINYKATIKDGNGNLVTGQPIDVRFTIWDDDTVPSNEYQETHTTTTDDNGVVVLAIGEGNPVSGIFHGLDWSAALYSLQVEVDIENDGTYVSFDPTPFQKVPYASHALSSYVSEVALNVEGLDAINEGNGIGWRLKDKDANKYAPIGENAVDLSESENNGTFYGASGENSFAVGKNARASGNHSIAIGHGTKAEEEGSIAIGVNNIAEPNALFTIGKGPLPFSFQNAMVIYKDGSSKFNDDMELNGWLTLNGLLVANQTIVVDGKIQRKGISAADMLPIAYGTVESDGNVLSGTGNFTASVDAGVFTIDVYDESLSANNSSCSVVPYSSTFRSSSVLHSSGNLNVYIYDISGNKVATTFQFVIYRL